MQSLYSPPKNDYTVVNDFIKCLLKKKVNERLCTFEKIKAHEFYKDFNWDYLIEFKLLPPYIPHLSPLKSFDYYTVRYAHYLENDKNSKKYKDNARDEKENEKKEKENDKYKFDPNWADIF